MTLEGMTSQASAKAAEALDVQAQGVLFDESTLRPLPANIGYRGPVACAAAGIDIPDDEPAPAEDQVEKFREFLDQVSPEDFG